MNLKKIIISNFILFITFGFIIGINFNNSSKIDTQAAENETFRVWFSFGTLYNDGQDRSWAYADAHTYIYAWNTSNPASPLAAWPGTKVVEGTSTSVNYDDNNAYWYFDIPQTYNRFKFARVNPSNSAQVWAQTNVDETLDGNTKNFRFLLGPDSFNDENRQVFDFSAVTTKAVVDFAATIDTDLEACSSTAAQNAINSYNSLSTFDQDQFDSFQVGNGFTGIQRLNYLKNFYNIVTPLN